MRLWILEDDRDRRLAMLGSALVAGFDVRLFNSASVLIQNLISTTSPPDCISLDHDLHLSPFGRDETGMQVATYLAARDLQVAQIIVHSSNEVGAFHMSAALQEARYVVQMIAPFGDLEWVPAWARLLPACPCPSPVPEDLSDNDSRFRLEVDVRTHELLQRWDAVAVVGVFTHAGVIHLFEAGINQPRSRIFAGHQDLFASGIVQREDCAGGFSMVWERDRIKCFARNSEANRTSGNSTLKRDYADTILKCIPMELHPEFRMFPS
jgi:hypothetical protein